MKGYGRSASMQKLFKAQRRELNSYLGSEPYPKRKPSPRKLEPHEVVAKLKARRESAAT